MARVRALLPGARTLAMAAVLLGLTPALRADVYSLDQPDGFPLDIVSPAGPNFDPEPPEAFLETVTEIVAWIAARSDYATDIALPAFIVLPRATLNYLFYSQMVGGFKGQDCINALYLPHVILLAEDFEITTCSDILVHELVHHFQFVTGKSFRCTAEAELEAYLLQAIWSAETGVGVPPSPLFLRRLTCDNPHEWGLRKP